MENWTGQCRYWCLRSTRNKKKQGTSDAWGNQLYVTEPAFCDEIAASSGLLMSKAGKCPAILLRGLSWSGEHGSASDMLREQKEDMFR